MTPTVGIGIVNRDRRELLLRCLESLAGTNWPHEVVVVDNGSTDGSAEAVSEQHPEVRVVEAGTNLGFAGGANRALRALAHLPYVALLNNDTVVAPGWLKPLVEALEADPGLGAVSPKILFEGEAPPVINNAGSILVEGGYGADRGLHEPDTGQYDRPEEVFAWCGAAVLLRREYLDDVGELDERLFLYYEDFDLSWRGQARGWRYRYVPASVVHHAHTASTVEGSALFDHYVERNRLLVHVKNAPAGYAAHVALSALWTAIVIFRRHVVRRTLTGKRPEWTLTRRRLRSFAAFLRLLPSFVVTRMRLRGRQRRPYKEQMNWLVPLPDLERDS